MKNGCSACPNWHNVGAKSIFQLWVRNRPNPWNEQHENIPRENPGSIKLFEMWKEITECQRNQILFYPTLPGLILSFATFSFGVLNKLCSKCICTLAKTLTAFHTTWFALSTCHKQRGSWWAWASHSWADDVFKKFEKIWKFSEMRLRKRRFCSASRVHFGQEWTPCVFFNAAAGMERCAE